MANAVAVPGTYGFDTQRSVLVVPKLKTASLYLLEGGSDDLQLSVDNDKVAEIVPAGGLTKQSVPMTGQTAQQVFTAEERRDMIAFKLSVRGVDLGETILHARLKSTGQDWIERITVRVVLDPSARQIGDDGIGNEQFKLEVGKLPIRQAVMRVAEDQLYSEIGQHTDGFRQYFPSSDDWCGMFAYWCWDTACHARGGQANPLGDNPNVLWSPQRAIGWALQSGAATIYQYDGGDPYGWKTQTVDGSLPLKDRLSPTTKHPPSKAEAIPWGKGNTTPMNPLTDGALQPGDICLVRDVPAQVLDKDTKQPVMKDGKPVMTAEWRHVCMVHTPPASGASAFVSIDGNQGMRGTPGQSIKKVSRNAADKLSNGQFKFAFIHLTGV